jgi:hypothetical protein
MRLPSISTLKSYINESEQCSGWQNKTGFQILESLTANNIWGYGRVGFFSHDSFKVQKGTNFYFIFEIHTGINLLIYLKRSSLEST